MSNVENAILWFDNKKSLEENLGKTLEVIDIEGQSKGIYFHDIQCTNDYLDKIKEIQNIEDHEEQEKQYTTLEEEFMTDIYAGVPRLFDLCSTGFPFTNYKEAANKLKINANDDLLAHLEDEGIVAIINPLLIERKEIAFGLTDTLYAGTPVKYAKNQRHKHDCT